MNDENLIIEKPPFYKTRFSTFVFAIVAALVVAVALGAGFLASNSNKEDEEADKDQKQQEVGVAAPFNLVYGYWTSNGSEVYSYDLSNHTETHIVTLPLNIKFISVIPDGGLLFINNVNDRDYGAEIALYDPNTKSTNTVISAESGYGIDDYAISKSGRYIATWEVKPLNGAGVLYGGSSRVYGYDRETGQKYLLYDEQAVLPVHYPVAITDSGEVFLDTFVPNIGAGWAFGMSKVQIDGSSRQDIASMVNGTYSSEPILSRDGSKLYFIGYNGSEGPGDEYVEGGFRRGMVASNTLEELDVATLQRQEVNSFSGDVIYNDLGMMPNGDLTFFVISSDDSMNGRFIYNFTINTLSKLGTDVSESVLGSFPGGLVVGVQSDAADAGGNLGLKYSQVFDTVSIRSASDISSLATTNSYIQYIDLIPQNNSTFSFNFTEELSDGEGAKEEKKQLQLKAQYFKPKLTEKREVQQSDPPREYPPGPPVPQPPIVPATENLPLCRDLGNAKCGQVRKKLIDEGQLPQHVIDERYSLCVRSEVPGVKCSDSPLYLYGREGMRVNVRFGTPVYNLLPSYDPIKGLSGLLTGDGGIAIDSNTYSSLSYDYNPAIEIKKPRYGIIVKKEDLKSKFYDYARRLGLKGKEIDETYMKIVSSIKSSFILLSHFDQETSKKILPLFFSPMPDNYYNVVFYVKELQDGPLHSVNPPHFEKIVDRSGFTAVEVSFYRE